jgi:hypothetical protein
MLSTPKIVDRPATPYAAVRRKIPMADITKVADTMSGEFFAWLGKRRIAPVDAPFFKYNSVGDDGQIDLEWGAPVPPGLVGDKLVHTGTLPAGRYVTAMYTGPFRGLLNWIAVSDLELDERRFDGGDSFGCRLEIYLTDPRAEPDSRKWRTEIAMRLADEI